MFPHYYDFQLTEKNKNWSYWWTTKQKNNFVGTLLLPPPNITGSLHLGHALNLVNQDFLVRLSYLQKKPINWLAGIDHAGISTQNKIESLAITGLDADEQKREYTLKVWYPQTRQIFYQQWEKLGLLIDYEKTRFTLDPAIQKQVRAAFIKLYQAGLIYRGVRLVNWDPQLKSVISDIETEHRPATSKLYYLKYPLLNPWEIWMEHRENCCGSNEEKTFDYVSSSGEKRGKSRKCQKYWELSRKFYQEVGKIKEELREKKKPCPNCLKRFSTGRCGYGCCHCPSEKITEVYWWKHNYRYLAVATSRPETIFADVALFVNPDDQRYQKYLNWAIKHPWTGKIIPLLTDKSIKIDFGSGVVKCTPGHDFSDYELGKKYQLPTISGCDEKGILNERAGSWQGQKMSDIREKFVQELEKRDICQKVKIYQTNQIFSSKSGAVVEPLLSRQWFLDLPTLIKQIEQKQPNFLEKITFFPPQFQQILANWKNKTQEWCISRQLWWGHPIPAWYHKKTGEIFVGEEPECSVCEEIKTSPAIICHEHLWEPEKDVLDTWFSSALWPIIIRTSIEDKFPESRPEYYPITTLITAYDIIFFWVLKMILLGFYFTSQTPFQQVLIHGLIRDSQGRKMSKSLGNGVEPEEIINKYGSDSLRLFLLENNIWGSDLVFSEPKIIGSWRFCQKLWSIGNLLGKKIPVAERRKISQVDWPENNLVNNWILNELAQCQKDYFFHLQKKEINIITSKLVKFTREKFSNEYLELSKISPWDTSTKNTFLFVYQQLLIMLHPLIPFITEHTYQEITQEKILTAEIATITREKKLDNDLWQIDCLLLLINSIRHNFFYLYINFLCFL